jgi:hypothetical protein
VAKTRKLAWRICTFNTTTAELDVIAYHNTFNAAMKEIAGHPGVWKIDWSGKLYKGDWWVEPSPKEPT